MREAGDATVRSRPVELGRWRDLLVGRWYWILLSMAITGVGIWYVQQGNWDGGFFFDEEWRANFVMSERPWERMLLHDTPTPIGWVYVMKAIVGPFGYRPMLFRLVSASFYLLASGVISLLVLRIGEREPRRLGPLRSTHRLPPHVAAIGVGLLTLPTLISHYYHYFNNYTFEVLWAALILLALGELGRTRHAHVVLAVLFGLAPLVFVGGMLILPAVALLAAWWASRAPVTADASRRQRIGVLFAGGVTALLTVGAVWVKLYKPIGSKPSISQWWIDDGAALGGPNTLVMLLQKAADQLFRGMIGPTGFVAGGGWWLLGQLLVVAFLVVGAVVIGRRWPALLVVAVSSYLLAILMSAVMHWPMTMVRVNLAFTFVIFLTITVGAVRAASFLVRDRLLLALVPLTLLTWSVRPDVWEFGPDTFSRHAVADLAPVVNHPAERNLVLTYHPLAHWYTHDALINIPHPGRTFELEWERQDDPDHLYVDLDAVIDRHDLSPGDMVWCTLNYHGGMRNLDACLIDRPDLQMVIQEYGHHTEVRGFLVVEPSTTP